MSTVTRTARIALSTASTYPDRCASSFALARQLGYDAMEVMVWTDPVTQEAGALLALSELHELPIVSIHAPTLLLTQRVWGSDPWAKVDRSIELALEVGAHVVVLHPPFRWQKGYAEGFAEGVAERERATGIELCVENMFPWRAGRKGGQRRELEAYLPHWDPVDQPYAHVTIDLSHTATAGSDAMAMAESLGDRLRHIHLADGLGSVRDEHLVPGRGSQPCGPLLETLAGQGFTGAIVVEVGTRKLTAEQREIDLAESLAFARLHFAAPVAT
jgi:sugar phosphate isomerase/epimerase